MGRHIRIDGGRHRRRMIKVLQMTDDESIVRSRYPSAFLSFNNNVGKFKVYYLLYYYRIALSRSHPTAQEAWADAALSVKEVLRHPD